MSTNPLSGNELREAVFAVVARELGPAILVRYIAENFSQPGSDYTEARRLNPDLTVEELAAEIVELKKRHGGSLKPFRG